MSHKFILLNLAPWPTLLSLVRHEPRDWMVWGGLPKNVQRRFADMGVEICEEPLPRPFHRGKLPEWCRHYGGGFVIPALGQPLPTRWPIVRHVASLGTPVYVAKQGTMARVFDIPATDAFTWALDSTGNETEATCDPYFDFSCVRADLLGDLLLVVPALKALARRGTIRLIIRQEWSGWIKELLPESDVLGLQLAPWSNPLLESAKTAVDLSPPDWASPLTPAIARAVPAKVHVKMAKGNSLSDMLAQAFDVRVDWPSHRARKGGYGVFIPSGSSLERLLPEHYWRYAIRRISESMGIQSWINLDPDDLTCFEKWPEVAAITKVTGYLEPASLIEMTRDATMVFGVSTALTHLASLCGTSSLVIEHPTTVPGIYRAPIRWASYIRPEKAWWRDDPTDEDVSRAIKEPDFTYGFDGDEWPRAIEQAIAQTFSTGGEYRESCP